MGQEPSTSGTRLTESQDPAELREEIEETRRELGGTVQALAAKTDVKARAKDQVEETRASVSAKKDELLGTARHVSAGSVAGAGSDVAEKARRNPPALAVAAFLAGLVTGRILKR